MSKVDLSDWQALQDEFLSGDEDEKAFCRTRGIDLKWFQRQLRNAEEQESTPDNPFVELISPAAASGTECCGALKVRFREVDFELAEGFSVNAFGQALQVIREVL